MLKILIKMINNIQIEYCMQKVSLKLRADIQIKILLVQSQCWNIVKSNRNNNEMKTSTSILYPARLILI